jgi:glucosamine--fructose-6-phosphate aminotransferase (isomerizing)
MTVLQETIAAQGDLLESTLAVDVGAAAARIEPARRIWLVGTGTSQHVAELGASMFAADDVDVRWASAAALAWREPRLTGDDAVVVISHTTETAFAQRARRGALEAGARVVSITGRGRGWREAIETVAPERSETYTASYTSALLVLARLASALGWSTFDPEQLGALPDRVRTAAGEGARLLDAPPARAIVLAGAGPAAVTAREGALKLREAAGVLAEGYEAEYLLHGSAVPLGAEDALLAIQPDDDRFGLLAAIADAASAEGLAVTRVEEPAGLDPVLAQVPLTVRLQALASRLADDRDVDPDTVIRGAWADEAMWSIGAPEP